MFFKFIFLMSILNYIYMSNLIKCQALRILLMANIKQKTGMILFFTISKLVGKARLYTHIMQKKFIIVNGTNTVRNMVPSECM